MFSKNIFSRKTVVIISSLSIALLVVVSGYFILRGDQYCDINKDSIKSQNQLERTFIPREHRITEETTKTYSLDDKLTITNTFRKACYEAIKASTWNAEIYTTLRFNQAIVGEFAFGVIGDDKYQNSSFKRLDKFKDYQIYKSESVNNSEKITLVRDTANFTYDTGLENIFIRIDASNNSDLPYQKVSKLEWQSTDAGKTWKFSGS
jgi:hypothetical protein